MTHCMHAQSHSSHSFAHDNKYKTKITIPQNATRLDTSLDPIQLGIFSHRFMSIAEQMGRALQRTSISTNIKERLDFSCALFGTGGRSLFPSHFCLCLYD